MFKSQNSKKKHENPKKNGFVQKTKVFKIQNKLKLLNIQ